jgi:FkbM family methyltransferase
MTENANSPTKASENNNGRQPPAAARFGANGNHQANGASNGKSELALRQRLAMMLNRGDPLSEAELAQTNFAVSALLNAGDPAEFLRAQKDAVPVAIIPRLLCLVNDARMKGQRQVAAKIEHYLRLARQHFEAPATPPAGMAKPPQAAPAPPAGNAATPLQQRIGRLMGLKGPASMESIQAANEFIALFLKSPQPNALLADPKQPVPAALPALILEAWGSALQGKDAAQIRNLEKLYGLVIAAQPARPVQGQPRKRTAELKRRWVGQTARLKHPHPIFASFAPFEGLVPAGFHADYVGAMIRAQFHNAAHQVPESRYIVSPVPPVDEEYFEFIDVLQTVAAASSQFTMIELGAGYGRWLVRAACAMRRGKRLPVRLVGVEAEPEHFRWLGLHLADNGLRPQDHQLIEAAVAAEDGEVCFHTGKPAEWYGQSVVPAQNGHNPDVKRVPAISLRTLLAGLEQVDLLDIDVQGAEFEVLNAAAGELDTQVKRLHVGTHNHEVEAGIRDLFTDLGWLCLNDYPCSSKTMTPFGQVQFQDGVQTWLNPKLA